MRLSSKIVAAIFRILFRIFIRLEIKGKENIPPTGPVLVVSNHLHLADPPLLILNLFPRKSHFMAKEELFQSRFFSILMYLAEAFPVRRGGTIKDMELALQQAVDLLKEGLVLGMFPEGGRSSKAQLLRGQPGVAVIALRSSALILPVGIVGTEKLKGMGWLKRPKVTMKFGEPFKLRAAEGRLSKSQLRQLTDSVMERIAALLPPEYRGDYKEAVESGN